MTSKKLLELVPTLQSLDLTSKNYTRLKKKKNAKDLLEQGTENIIGTELIRENAKLIALLD